YASGSFDVCRNTTNGWETLTTSAGASGDRITSGTTGMYTYNNTSATIATNGVERIVVGTNGNVGIGIQPVSGYALGVSGSLYTRGRFDLANNGQAVHIGTNAGSSANTDGVVIGYGAGSNSNVDQVSLIGWLAGEYNEGTNVTGVGRQAAQYNKGDGVLAFGDGAAQGNQGDAVFAIGDEAAHSNTANTVVAFGSGAARNNSGTSVIALGNFAAQNNGGANVTAVGHSAVNSNMFTNVTGLGYNAQPTANNQVMLGDTNITAVSTSGIYYGKGLYVSGLVSATSITINGQPIASSNGASTYASLTDIKYDKANYNLSGPSGITSASTGLQYSTAFGINALSNPTYNGVNSTAFGASALASNTGDENTAVGSFALSSNTTALANTAVGSVALQYNTTGSSNSAFGAAALATNATGSGNTAVGTSALQGLSTGSYNTAMGSGALKNPTKLNHVVAIGYRAGYGSAINTSSTNSVFIGSYAGNAITTGNSNTLIGYNTGAGITTGHNNLVIGTNLSPFSNTGSNQLNIANAIFGDYGTSLAAKIGINVTSPTTHLEVSGTISATQILINGVAVTAGSTPDRIVSGSTSMIAASGTISALTSSFRISDTTAASTLANLNASTSGISRIRFGHATGYQLGIGREGNNGFIDYPNRFAIRMGTVNASSGASNTTIMNFDSSGNVGIGGLTTAQTVLHVSGTLRIANGGEACDTNRLGAIRYTSGTFSICQNTTNGWESLATSGSSTTDRIISGTTGVYTYNNTSATIATAGVERLIVGTNGNVGIRVQPTTYTLDISGTAMSRGDPSGWLTADRANPTRISGFYATNGLTRLWDSVGGDRLVINTTNGNVGIGTLAPNSSLEVSGTFKTTRSGEGILWTGRSDSLVDITQDTSSTLRTMSIHPGISASNVFQVYTNIGGTYYSALAVANGTRAVGINTSIPSTTLHVAGTLRLGNGGETCDTYRIGAIRYSGGSFSVCANTSNGWESLATSAGINSDRITSGTLAQVIAQTAGTVQISSTGLFFNYGGNNDTRLELGSGATGNRNSYIDFVGDTTYTDYGLRLWRIGGANSDSQLLHRGTGNLQLNVVDAGYMTIYTNNTERLRITSSSFIGIGTTSPLKKLHVASSDSMAGILLERTSADSNGPVFVFKKSREGALAQSGDSLGSLFTSNVINTDGTIRDNYFISTYASENHTATGVGNQIVFRTVPNGSLAGQDRMIITNDGNVGIGVSNTLGYKLYVAGNAYSTGTWGASDARFKENIHSMTGLLNTVAKLRPVTFTWNAKAPVKDDKNEQIGLIAQEVEAVYPDLVRTNTDGYKAVAYDKLSVLLLGAVKELKSENDTLKAQNDAILKRLEALEAKTH
ncbi:MAG: hypothetical protein DI585_00965, partial [Pseudomonas fluorescens]